MIALWRADMEYRLKALPLGRAFFICLLIVPCAGPGVPAATPGSNGETTEDEARRLGEEFGIVVDSVDEEVRKELKMQRAEGVAVFEVIGNSRADYAGIKVRSVVKEIDKVEVKSLADFGRALKRAMPQCNFTVGTYERGPRRPGRLGRQFSFRRLQTGLSNEGRRMRRVTRLVGAGALSCLLLATALYGNRAVAQKADGATPDGWVAEIEKLFIRSEDCKQCHDRHYEEWKGMREQTPDLKTFGRVDAALLHGTSLESPIFKTVLGLWLQTNPTSEQRTQCLSCHAPAVTVFPQHTDKINAQVLSGKVEVEGIGCASCHLINAVADKAAPPPTFKIAPGNVIYGPFADPEENLVHPSSHSDLFRGANYCTSCHFDKVKDVTRRDLPGEILQGTVCQDCHMEPSTGSSTSKRGSLTRSIGRHWFRGVVIPGVMLKNRNLQAEWMPRLDIDANATSGGVQATVLVRSGSLPHGFPDGDPVLKQFFVTIMVKDAKGNPLASDTKRFGLPYQEILRGPIPEPLVKGGTTKRVAFQLALPDGSAPAIIEALLTYSLIPEPDGELKTRYLATLKTDAERQTATKLIDEYALPRVLTFRTRAFSPEKKG